MDSKLQSEDMQVSHIQNEMEEISIPKIVC